MSICPGEFTLSVFHVELIADTMMSICKGSLMPHSLSLSSFIAAREVNVSQPLDIKRSVYIGSPLSTKNSCTLLTLLCSGLRLVSADSGTCKEEICRPGLRRHADIL